ncbi:MAG: HesA/MoeB/ThiF family protein [Woeseiaceae bacterium]
MNRHARHHALPQVGEPGQRRIANATALLIGVGGIGCATASHLAASGVGKLVLCDFDTVDETNLGRQTLYGPADVGKSKAEIAAQRLRVINPDIDIVAVDERLQGNALANAVSAADVVLDATDNFSSRFQINDAAVAASRCLISGAAIRFEGQVAEFGPAYDDAPCYRCLYTEADESLENCAGNGVLGPVPGVIGSIMAVEALKFLAGIEWQRGTLRLYDAISGDVRKLRIDKRSDCETCS